MNEVILREKRVFLKTKKNESHTERNNIPFEQPDEDYFIKEYIGENSENVVIVNSKNRNDFDIFLNIKYKSIVNKQRLNDIRYINKYLEKVNSILPVNGIFIGNFESSVQRFNRITEKYPKIYAHFYFFGTFILKRVFPKWGPTKKIYFFLTKGSNRYLSVAEVLGRLISCGFEIVDYREIDKKIQFAVKKVKEPSFNNSVSYGPIIKLNRIGKDGKQIKVYKFRTMHPYAEYLQEYIHIQNKLKEGGKFNNDFRITSWGRIFRKLWIDELPMLFNLLKGDLKLVGVRPLSSHYLHLYNEEIKELRKKTKPGLLPPYYADMPKTLEQIMESEKNYLEQYFEEPFVTDLKYIKLIFKNIVLRGKRSS